MITTIPTGNCLIALFAACASSLALSQSYPAKPVRVVTQFAAGAAGDVLTRIVTTQLQEALGQPVIVDNRPGAGGVVAAETVARAAPDGYTLLIAGPGTQVIRVYLVKQATFDPIKDFTPITGLGDSPVVIVAHPSLPVGSFRELLDYAKTNPNKISYGTSGIGSQHHLGGEQIALMTGTRMVHVPYKAGAQALVDLVAGQLQLSYSVIGPALPMIKAGKARALTVISDKRIAQLPDVPAITEVISGYSPFRSWVGLFGPAQLPDAILRRLNSDTVKGITSAMGRSKVIDAGYEPIPGTPEEFSALIARDLSFVGRVVKAANIQPTE
ncbi:MAG: Bug family tripartite tricarboxylate transporter substrate binding protein [Burkholderiales bacterium]